MPGADKLLQVFGHWPSFHDAEVVRFLLERSESHVEGPSILADIHTFEMTDEVGANGAYVSRKHTLVSFRFAGVAQVELDGFNNQNALWDLAVVDIRSRQMEHLHYEVSLDSSFGMGAHFLCRDVAIDGVRPWPDPRGDIREIRSHDEP